MEDNLHDDNKLEDYVRQSFDGYEEDPAADMWQRVETELPPQERTPALRLVFYRYQWQAAAAAVIFLLLSTLVCGHLYYERQLRALSAKASEVPVLSTENPGETAVFQEKSEAKRAQSAAAQAATESGDNGDLLRSSKPQPVEGASSSGPVAGGQWGQSALRNTGAQQRKEVPTSPQNSGNQPVRHEEAPSTSQQVVQTGHEGQKNSSATPDAEGAGTATTLPPAAADGATNDLSATLEASKQIDLQGIAPRPVLLASPVSPSAAREPLPIKPARSPSGWYLGTQATFLTTQEKKRDPITRPGSRPLFVSTQEAPDLSSIWWLKVGKTWGTHFTLESGVGYQKTEQSATHTPRFRFAEGTHTGGPSAGTPRTYNYDLSTYGGTAEVALRMEQTSPGTPAPDNEPVPLKITTTERNELLRIPVVAGYRLGTGRWRASLKAGLLGNFVLKNELDISARVSQNARFRPVAGRQGYAVQMSDLEKFSLGYLLSAGAEFRCSRHLSVVAEPVLMGDFARKDPQGRRLPEHISTGLNVGARWYF